MGTRLAPFDGGMHLAHGLQLAYCTNIHRGESWPETMASLSSHAMAVRQRVAPDAPFAIGLRLSDAASRELAQPGVLGRFREWLHERDAYVFTINGFPFGTFHGTRVKEQVYAPDWTRPERVAYTQRLFQILVELLPDNPSIQGSVSTVPVSWKGFGLGADAERSARAHLWEMVDFLERLAADSGRDLHLGLEPEPCCHLETSAETVAFFQRMRDDRPGDRRIDRFLGVNYDCCHLAVEFETASEALGRLRDAGIRISKFHLSNALAVRPTATARESLRAFLDPVYFHQVVERRASGELQRHRDLDIALATPPSPSAAGDEWRIHFHVPLHARPREGFATTADHVSGVLDEVQRNPSLCQHFEMETYTWEVLPADLKQASVVDQLAAEYAWTLGQLGQRGLVPTNR
ncbi:MAG: metabolite traffic protein EboE [Verrucomicrobiota bacterium]